MNHVKDRLLVIRLREGARLHIASFACQMFLDPRGTATEILSALVTVYAFITAQLIDNVNLTVQVVILVMLRGACSHSHDISSRLRQPAI